MFFNFVDSWQVTLSHKFGEMFHQEPSPLSNPFILDVGTLTQRHRGQQPPTAPSAENTQQPKT